MRPTSSTGRCAGRTATRGAAGHCSPCPRSPSHSRCPPPSPPPAPPRAAAAPTPPSRRRLVAILVVWAAVSAQSYHPHYMSYFNEIIGPRVNAYRFLADSNLDWEDRSRDHARFRAEHPEILLVVEPEAPRAGWILVGANKLVGVYEPERYRWLRENFRPERHVGYSYLLFRVTPERLQEVRSRVSLNRREQQ